MNDRTGIFEDVIEFPDGTANRRFTALVGLDDKKERLLKEARLMLDPETLNAWSKKHHHGQQLKLVELFRDRPPLFVFAGDVGTGKSALAETFGDAVARQTNLNITLFALSLTARGTGAVGEMTTLLSAAFNEVKNTAIKVARSGKKAGGIILLIDEADALAQSREMAQMHHEDRAGVNALIRGIDDLATGNLPVIVVMCTNRLSALDPAVRRRAAAIFIFTRPNDAQRQALLSSMLDEAGFSLAQLSDIVKATGPQQPNNYGYTYSDITQRLLPALVLAAFPDKPITFDLVKDVIAKHPPTPPFQEEQHHLSQK